MYIDCCFFMKSGLQESLLLLWQGSSLCRHIHFGRELWWRRRRTHSRTFLFGNTADLCITSKKPPLPLFPPSSFLQHPQTRQPTHNKTQSQPSAPIHGLLLGLKESLFPEDSRGDCFGGHHLPSKPSTSHHRKPSLPAFGDIFTPIHSPTHLSLSQSSASSGRLENGSRTPPPEGIAVDYITTGPCPICHLTCVSDPQSGEIVADFVCKSGCLRPVLQLP